MKTAITLALAGVFIGIGATRADATPIITFSGTPAGMTFTIESVAPAADLYTADGTNDTYLVTLQLATSTAYTNTGTNDSLESVGLDFGGSVDAATGSFSGLSGANWAFSTDIGINGSGKCAGTVAGESCAEEDVAPTNLVLDADGTYQWLFTVDLPATGFGTTTTLEYAISQVRTSGPNTSWDLLSSGSSSGGSLSTEGGTLPDAAPVPEPTSLVLVSTGVAVAAARFRRRRNT